MANLPDNFFMVLSFGFGLVASILYSFGPLNGMKGKLLSPIEDKDRGGYGLVAVLVILSIVCMAMQIYAAGMEK